VGKKEHVMKAIAIDDFGAPPSLHDLPVPEPGEGEVLVRVRASSVNGFDVAVAGGHLKGMTEHHFPVVLGKDFAGTVEAVGPSVQSARPGEVVFAVVIKAALGGAFGEYVTAPEAYTARVPAGLDLTVAGALDLAGTAALAAVDAVAPLPGETVLISGATDGVGGFAVQLRLPAKRMWSPPRGRVRTMPTSATSVPTTPSTSPATCQPRCRPALRRHPRRGPSGRRRPGTSGPAGARRPHHLHPGLVG
jgi:D-arabinose 1-dehydrogenase-like Zn-dependent alcohol dehydrogenase